MQIKPEDYVYKLKPFDHQEKAFKLSRDEENFALFMEQGTGKTKVTLDTAAWLYLNGKVDMAIVLAPNGVHRNWVDEVEKHLPEHIPYIARFWDSKRAKTKKFMDWLNEVHQEGNYLRFIFANIEAINFKGLFDVVSSCLLSYKVLLIIDESHYIKNWNSGRSKKLYKLRMRAYYRRILTGTPYTNQPSDLFGQFRFLDEEILGHSSVYTFQARYYQLVEDPGTLIGLNKQQIKEIMLLRKIRENAGPRGGFIQIPSRNPDGSMKFQRMDELKSLIDPHSFRVTKEECLDLPPKLYQIIYTELSQEQKDLYETLKKDFIIELEDGELTAAMAMVRLLRLQQILGGFLPLDGGELRELECPAMKHSVDLIKGFSGKTIIWARFTAEVEKLFAMFGDEAVKYRGEMSDDDLYESQDRFKKDPDVRYFVGNPAKGATGLDLWAATNVFYYSNSFRLDHRLQSEDRAHRIGQEHPVTYYDRITPNTIDTKIVAALKEKKNVADIVTGDNIKNLVKFLN